MTAGPASKHQIRPHKRYPVFVEGEMAFRAAFDIWEKAL